MNLPAGVSPEIFNILSRQGCEMGPDAIEFPNAQISSQCVVYFERSIKIYTEPTKQLLGPRKRVGKGPPATSRQFTQAGHELGING